MKEKGANLDPRIAVLWREFQEFLIKSTASVEFTHLQLEINIGTE